jgi:hypothetical protein
MKKFEVILEDGTTEIIEDISEGGVRLSLAPLGISIKSIKDVTNVVPEEGYIDTIGTPEEFMKNNPPQERRIILDNSKKERFFKYNETSFKITNNEPYVKVKRAITKEDLIEKFGADVEITATAIKVMSIYEWTKIKCEELK